MSYYRNTKHVARRFVTSPRLILLHVVTLPFAVIFDTLFCLPLAYDEFKFSHVDHGLDPVIAAQGEWKGD